jgi:hypothetical protein
MQLCQFTISIIINSTTTPFNRWKFTALFLFPPPFNTIMTSI